MKIQVEKATGAEPYSGKSIYLKNGSDVLGLHATMFEDDQMEAWANAYDSNFKFLGSIYRIFGPIEEEAKGLIESGWTDIDPPPTEVVET